VNSTLDQLRRDIESTRYALGEKIATLENKIETTKNTTLNPAYYVRTRPWPILGAVTVMGYFVGRALKSKPSQANTGSDAGIIGGITRSMMVAASSALGRMAVDTVREKLNKRKGTGGNGSDWV